MIETLDNGNKGGCFGCKIEQCNTSNTFNWINIKPPDKQHIFNYVEVAFKNNRKVFYKNDNHLELSIGDIVAVEATKGHDIGVVSLVGELVRLQMKKKNYNVKSEDNLQIYRKAKKTDISKWKEAIAQEKRIMQKTREIVGKTGLEMKIYNVEYQGDMTKLTFYYIAEERVDFRELIKILAEEFKVRIEMRQFGYRQEASHLGGIGSCGKELCCSTWLSEFKTVSTNDIRYQQLSSNPLKLTGQCGKLKCCMKYELETYMDEIRDFPKEEIRLRTLKGDAVHQKTDVFKRMMWYSYSNASNVLFPVSVDKAKEVIEMNQKGIIPEDISDIQQNIEIQEKGNSFTNVVGQDSVSRFDKKTKHRNKHESKKGVSK